MQFYLLIFLRTFSLTVGFLKVCHLLLAVCISSFIFFCVHYSVIDFHSIVLNCNSTESTMKIGKKCAHSYNRLAVIWSVFMVCVHMNWYFFCSCNAAACANPSYRYSVDCFHSRHHGVLPLFADCAFLRLCVFDSHSAILLLLCFVFTLLHWFLLLRTVIEKW